MVEEQTENVIYYVRHKCCISRSLLKRFFDDDLIAIHYNDQESWNVSDYDKRGAKQAISLFNKINEKGGWVIADYSGLKQKKEVLIGRVKINSKHFEAAKSKCEKYKTHGECGKGFEPIHKYKVIQLEGAKRFSADDYLLLRLPFGQGTICETRVIGLKTLEHIYKGKSLPEEVESLHPMQVELLCQEYLRRFYRTKLEFLLHKVGEQLKDIDIIGEDRTGKKILAQVSHEIKCEKLERLGRHKDENALLIYFGPKNPQQEYLDIMGKYGIDYVDTSEVFDKMLRGRITQDMIKTFLRPNFA